MSFETITLARKYPIINGYVQLPPNLDADKDSLSVADALTAYAGSYVEQLTMGSGVPIGFKSGAQQIFVMPAITL